MALGALELNAYPLLDSMAVQFLSAGIDVKYSLGRGLGSFSYAVACVLLGRQATALGVESLLLTHAVLLLFLLGVTAAFPSMRGKLNSLNASAAAAILLYEAVRQRIG